MHLIICILMATLVNVQSEATVKVTTSGDVTDHNLADIMQNIEERHSGGAGSDADDGVAVTVEDDDVTTKGQSEDVDAVVKDGGDVTTEGRPEDGDTVDNADGVTTEGKSVDVDATVENGDDVTTEGKPVDVDATVKDSDDVTTEGKSVDVDAPVDNNVQMIQEEPTEDVDAVLKDMPISLIDDYLDSKVDLPLCKSSDNWALNFQCYHPKEAIRCNHGDERPLCKCPKDYRCMSRGIHETKMTEPVTCVFMCKSPETHQRERADLYQYDMGLKLAPGLGLRGKK